MKKKVLSIALFLLLCGFGFTSHIHAHDTEEIKGITILEEMANMQNMYAREKKIPLRFNIRPVCRSVDSGGAQKKFNLLIKRFQDSEMAALWDKQQETNKHDPDAPIKEEGLLSISLEGYFFNSVCP